MLVPLGLQGFWGLKGENAADKPVITETINTPQLIFEVGFQGCPGTLDPQLKTSACLYCLSAEIKGVCLHRPALFWFLGDF